MTSFFSRQKIVTCLQAQVCALFIALASFVAATSALFTISLNARAAQATEPRAGVPVIIQLEKELYCSGGKAGGIIVVKGKNGAPNTEQFLTLAKYFLKKNKGKPLTAKQKKAAADGGKLCSAFTKAETLYVDNKLKRSCGQGGNYSFKNRLCEKKAGKVLGFKTIQEAVNRAGPGDKVVIREGTYSEAVKVRRPGELTKPLTITSQSGEGVSLDGKNSKAAAFILGGQKGNGGKFSSSFVTIRSLRISHYTGAGVSGVVSISDSQAVTTENLVFTGNKGVAVSYAQNSPNAVVWGNVISSFTGAGSGISLLEDNRSLVAYNVVSGATNFGISLGAGTTSVSPSVLHHNVIIGSGGNGIQVKLGAGDQQYLTGLFHNVSLYSGVAGIFSETPSTGGIALRNSVVAGSLTPLNLTGELAGIGINASDTPLSLELTSTASVVLSPFATPELWAKTAITKAVTDALSKKTPKNKDYESAALAAFVRVAVAKALLPSASLVDAGEDTTPAFPDLVGRAPIGTIDIGAVEGTSSPETGPGIPTASASSEVLALRAGGTSPSYLLRSRYGSNGGGGTATPTPTRLADTPTATPTVTASPTSTTNPNVPVLKVPTLIPNVPMGDLADGYSFIYSGPNAVQRDVQPGTIVDDRLTILRGRVRFGLSGIAGVKVFAPEYPALGYTLTRLNGEYDFAANGGAAVRLRFEKVNFIPVERVEQVNWQEFRKLDDIVLTAIESKSTKLTLSQLTGPAIASGTQSTDDDGDGRGLKSRTARAVFLPGTTAYARLPDGSSTLLDTITVHATELTVGPDGPAKMPASLPPSSGYTYAVELRIDEAEALGAETVEFSQRVPVYVENFLGFPVGSEVPAGYYDRKKGHWIPSQNGRVIKVVSVVRGIAAVDVTGDGTADSGATLDELHIGAAELAVLGSTYAAGTSVWRVEVPHFSFWDFNWGWGPPADARFPDGKDPNDPRLAALQCTTDLNGSIIECENQTLRETLPIPGTGLSLNYSSARVKDRKSGQQVEIPLRSSELPSDVIAVHVVVRYLGREEIVNFSPAETPMNFKFEWDGKDAYGREVEGVVPAQIRVGYEYPGYYGPPPKGEGFGGYSDSITGDGARLTVTLWSQTREIKFNRSNRALVGGWTLSPHHFYSVAAGTVLFGDGTFKSYDPESAREVSSTTSNYIGSEISASPGEEVLEELPARDLRFVGPSVGLWGSANAAGQIFVASGDGRAAANAHDYDSPSGSLIYLVRADGIAHLIAGGTAKRFEVQNSTNGRLLSLGTITSIISDGQDGAIFIQTGLDFCPGGALPPPSLIRHITVDGVVTNLAGATWSKTDACNIPPFKEGSIATANRLSLIDDVVLLTDGSIVFRQADVLRKVSTSGVMSTLSATGTSLADRIPLRDVKGIRKLLGSASDGGFYIGRLRLTPFQSRSVSKVMPDGTVINITPRTGNDDFDQLTDPYTYGVVETRRGEVLLGLKTGFAKVSPSGPISQISGISGEYKITDLGSPSRNTYHNVDFVHFPGPRSMFQTPAGELITSLDDHVAFTSRLIRHTMIGNRRSKAGEYSIPSSDGSEIYDFSSIGLHLRTVDALTGQKMLTFGYNADKQLASITDAFSNVVQITYNASGFPSSILSPFGQKTFLSTDASSFITQVAYEDGSKVDLGYSNSLLTSLRDRGNNLHTFSYNAEGRLLTDTGPSGNSTTLAKVGNIEKFDVTATSKLGRQRKVTVDYSTPTIVTRKTLAPDGQWSQSVKGADDTVIVTNSAGVKETSKDIGDPYLGMRVKLPKFAYEDLPSGLSRISSFEYQYTNSGSELITTKATTNYKTWTSVYNVGTKSEVITSPLGKTQSLNTDVFGRVTKSKVASFADLKFTYGGFGRLASIESGTGADLRKVTFGYDSKGFLGKITNALNQDTRYEYDSVGKLTKQTLPDGRQITFGYDLAGNVTAIGPPGRPSHVFSYTANDERETWTPPADSDDGGTDGLPTTYFYNGDRQLDRIQTPGGQDILFSYDSTRGRLNSMQLPEGTLNLTYENGTGFLSTIGGLAGSNYGVDLGFEYDGGLITKTSWSGNLSGTVSFGYDNFFRISSLKVGSLSPLTFEYDDDGLLTKAGDLTLTRDAATGFVTDTSYQKIKDTYTYSQTFGEFEGYVASDTNSSPATSFYVEGIVKRDPLGRISQRAERTGGLLTFYQYTYDLAGRLTEVRQSPNGANYVLTATYAYDSNGNRTSVTRSTVTETGTYDNQDRLLTYGGDTYEYDNNGQLKQKTTGGLVTQYRYDIRGALRKVEKPDGTVISYQMDASGRRVGKLVNGVRTKGFLYQSALQIAAELDGAGAITKQFVYGTKFNVPDYFTTSTGTFRIISDHLGSVKMVVNAVTGAVVQRISYDEFGKIVTDTNPGFQPFGFAGGLYDPDTQLTRFGARDYDPKTGRWAAKDPIDFEGEDTNLYGYVMADPVNFIDSTGESPLGIAIRVGKWGLKYLKGLSRDEVKFLYRKRGADIYASKKQIKKLSKKKGCPTIIEKHGEGVPHGHPPRRMTSTGKKGGHGFILGTSASLLTAIGWDDKASDAENMASILWDFVDPTFGTADSESVSSDD